MSDDQVKEIEFPIDYSEQYVAFIDILGFSALTMNTARTERDDKREQKIHLQRVIQSTLSTVRAFRYTRFKVMFVSDSIILSVDESDLGDLVPLCQLVSGIQRNLLDHNLLTRGAISKGEAQIIPSEDKVFGPAFVQAVELEKHLVVFPRVIIDPIILRGKTRGQLIRSTTLESGTKMEQQLLTSSEGQFNRGDYLNPDHFLFVDYLALPVRQKEVAFFEKLYQFMQTNLARPTPHLAKYQWMKDYIVVSLRKQYDESEFIGSLCDRFGDL